MAASRSSTPCAASSDLFAVTTGIPRCERLQHEGTCRLDPAKKLHEDVGRRGEERAGIYDAPGGRGQRWSRPERVADEGVRYPEGGL